MVKIIQAGTKSRVECSFCGAILEYCKDDVHEEETYISQRDSYFKKYIKCPQCDSKVYLETQKQN